MVDRLVGTIYHTVNPDSAQGTAKQRAAKKPTNRSNQNTGAERERESERVHFLVFADGCSAKGAAHEERSVFMAQIISTTVDSRATKTGEKKYERIKQQHCMNNRFMFYVTWKI